MVKNYEILNEENEVINIIVAEQWFVDEFHPNRYREITEPESLPKTIFTPLGFRSLFTLEEQVAIRNAQSEDMEVGIIYDNFLAATFIDIEDERVQQGLALYVDKGLITNERMVEVLTPIIREDEELEPSEAHTFTALEFLGRFTVDEQMAVRQARSTDDLVAIAYEWFMESEYVDVRDPMTQQGIDLYIGKGLIEPARRAEVLSPKEE